MTLLDIFALVLVVYTARAIYQNLVSPWKNAPPGMRIYCYYLFREASTYYSLI